MYWCFHHHNKNCTHNILLPLFHLYLFHLYIVRSHKRRCLVGFGNDQDKYIGKWILSNLTETMFWFVIAICLYYIKEYIVSVYCFYVGGLLGIFISNKSLLQIKGHTHTFSFPCFNRIVSIKSHFTYINHNFSNSGVSWYHKFQGNQLYRNMFRLKERWEIRK